MESIDKDVKTQNAIEQFIVELEQALKLLDASTLQRTIADVLLKSKDGQTLLDYLQEAKDLSQESHCFMQTSCWADEIASQLIKQIRNNIKNDIRYAHIRLPSAPLTFVETKT